MNKVPIAFLLLWGVTSIPFTYGADSNSSLVPISEQVSDEEARFTLAKILGEHTDSQDRALELLKGLMAKDHDNASVLLEMAQIYLSEKEYANAITLFHRLRNLSYTPKEGVEIAQLGAWLGYAEWSQQQFAELYATGKATLFEYVDALLSWGDFYRAEELCRQGIAQKPSEDKYVLYLIKVLIAEQRFDEAEDYCRDQIAKTGNHLRQDYLELLVQLSLGRKDYSSALDVIDNLIQMKPNERRYLSDKASALSFLEEYSKALPLYRQLQQADDFKNIGHLGAGKCLLQLGHSCEAQQELAIAAKSSQTRVEAEFYLAGAESLDSSFVTKITSKANSGQELLQWTDCYRQTGSWWAVYSLCRAAIELDDAYLPAKMTLGEAYTGLYAFKYAADLYKELLRTFPSNSKLLMEHARTTSYNKEYISGIKLYSQLIALNSGDPIPQLEQARVAYWGKLDPLWRQLYRKLLYNDHNCRGWAKALLEKKHRLEFAANWLGWNYHYIATLPVYGRLMELEPYSNIWPFEYAQSLCDLGVCDEARGIYAGILKRDPGNTLAHLAWDRETYQLNPSITLNGIYWQEVGYGDLNQIARYEVNTAFCQPLDSCQQHVRLLGRNWIEHTYWDGGFHHADGVSLLWDRRFNAAISATAAATFKHYRHRFGVTYTGLGAVTWNCDYLQAILGWDRSDVVVNYFNLVQKTQRSTTSLALHCPLTHKFTCNVLGEYCRYNDHNNAVHAAVDVAYALSEYPKVFKICLLGEYRNTAHLNIYIYNPEGQLVDIIYPYWTPQRYFVGQVLLEWRFDYSLLEFCAAPVQFCDVKIACGDDNQNNPYYEIKAEWHHETFRHWQFSLIAYLHGSPQWNGKGIWMTCGYQF